MTYDHCPRCGSHDIQKVGSNSYTTYYRCEDCDYEFEIEDAYYGYDSSWGWQNAVDEEDDD